MPNWVTTILCIEGDQKELDKFQDYVRNDNYYRDEEDPKKRVSHFDFNKFIPMPKVVQLEL